MEKAKKALWYMPSYKAWAVAFKREDNSIVEETFQYFKTEKEAKRYYNSL